VTLSYWHVLVPTPGPNPSTASCETLTGYERAQDVMGRCDEDARSVEAKEIPHVAWSHDAIDVLESGAR
jgi:hypothetical protein